MKRNHFSVSDSLETALRSRVRTEISSEYSELKGTLLRNKNKLKKVLEEINKKAHSDFLASHKSFMQLISAATSTDSQLRQNISEATEAVNTFRNQCTKLLESESAPARLMEQVKNYISELEDIEEKCLQVEIDFIAIDKFERKVSRSMAHVEKRKFNRWKKKEKQDDNPKKTKQLVEKYQSKKEAFSKKLESTKQAMKDSDRKYEKIFKLAHSAYWLLEDQLLNLYGIATKSIRDNCIAAKDEFFTSATNEGREDYASSSSDPSPTSSETAVPGSSTIQITNSSDSTESENRSETYVPADSDINIVRQFLREVGVEECELNGNWAELRAFMRGRMRTRLS